MITRKLLSPVSIFPSQSPFAAEAEAPVVAPRDNVDTSTVTSTANNPKRNALFIFILFIFIGNLLRLIVSIFLASRTGLARSVGGCVIAGVKNGFNGLCEEARDGKSQRQTRIVLPG